MPPATMGVRLASLVKTEPNSFEASAQPRDQAARLSQPPPPSQNLTSPLLPIQPLMSAQPHSKQQQPSPEMTLPPSLPLPQPPDPAPTHSLTVTPFSGMGKTELPPSDDADSLASKDAAGRAETSASTVKTTADEDGTEEPLAKVRKTEVMD